LCSDTPAKLEHLESPDALESGGSLRSSLTAFTAVLTSPAFLQRVAPFIPARLRLPDSPTWVGLKGAGGSANPDDASTEE